MEINRKVGPPIKPIERLVFPKITYYSLDNGVPVTEVNIGTQEITKMDLVFHAGRTKEDYKLISRGTASLIKEGTSELSSSDIAEKIDYYGASLSTSAGLDAAHISAFCLSKYAEEVFPVVAEILLDPVFPEDELHKFIKTNKQKLSYDLSKNDIISYRKITEVMFGEDHAYGYNSTPELYDTLTRDKLIGHHRHYFTSDNFQIFLSGHVTEQMRDTINRLFGGLKSKSLFKAYQPAEVPPHSTCLKLEDGSDQQASIRIGRRLFNRKHEDYAGMFMLNTILGGYFGSRLMNSIREDKGYTYNIYSSLDPLIHDGYFYIGTEVSNDFIDVTMAEVYRQIAILQSEEVNEGELQMVRNYIMGNLLTMLDGPFNVAKIARTLRMAGLDIAFYDRMVKKIQTINSTEIRLLAQKYLTKENMIEVIVGRNLN